MRMKNHPDMRIYAYDRLIGSKYIFPDFILFPRFNWMSDASR